MHLLNFSIFSFTFTCCLIMAVSLFSRPILDKYINGLTFTSRNNALENFEIPSSIGWGKNHFCAAANLNADSCNQEIHIFDKTINYFSNDKVIIKMGFLKKTLFFICGIEKEIEEDSEVQKTSLDYDNFDPYWTKICNLSAILIISITGFIIAFLNKFN